MLTVEDHYAEGGLGEAVRSAPVETDAQVRCLTVCKRPRSGTPEKLLDDQSISARAIVEEIKRAVSAEATASEAVRN